jgi:DNA-binding beta-propeller fold protein YncE
LLALDPGTNMLYVAGNDASIVEALDPQTCMVRHTVDVGGFVSGIAVAVVGSGVAGGNGNELWVSTDHALMIYDAVGKALASIPMTDDPGYLCIPAGAVAYVVTRQGVVDAVDLHSRRILAPLLTGGNFAPMDYDATTGEVYVPDRLHHQLDVLAPVSPGTMALPHEPERIIPVDAVPQSIAITSDGQLGFVALEDGTVMMLDIPGRQTIHRFSVGGHPRFIITGLYPSVISLTPQQSTIYAIVDNVAHYAASVVVVLITIIAIVVHRRKMRRSQ